MEYMFRHIEGKDNYFKIAEILYYIYDAINTFDRAEYFHGGKWFALSIIKNSLNKFSQKETDITITDWE